MLLKELKQKNMNNQLELSEAKLNPDRFLSSRLGDKDRLHMEL